ncbi:MAG: FkbM family methyltransferase [Gammaproteobacteria bacterium]|nr:FkbM family methyltransferase [Gammaproteobacteria bacterium]
MNHSFSYLDKNVYLSERLKHWRKLWDGYLIDGKFYEDEFLNYTKSLQLNGTYIDIGANIGNHTLYWALFSAARSIACFEALPRFSNILIEQLILNKVLHKCTIHPFGLSDNSEYVDITFFDSITPTWVERLDNVNISEPVTLIKIDVEGMEPKVLKGGLNIIKRNRPVIFAEASKKDQLDEIMDVLKPIGYKTTKNVFNHTPTYEIICE